MGAKYIIDGDIIRGMADGVRTMYCETDTMTPAQIESKIKNTRIGVPIDVAPVSHINSTTGRWERPSEWPDLGSLTIGDDFDGVYLTYDLTKIENPWMAVYTSLNVSGNVCIDRGHIVDGEFVVDEHHAQAHNTSYRQSLDSTYGDYQVFRITPETNGSHIVRHGFSGSEATDTSTCLPNSYQPCIERVGRMDYISNFESSIASRASISYVTQWLEYDHVECAGLSVVRSMNSTWNLASSLQEVYVDWDTNNWEVTTMVNLFANCSMLKNIIGIENWDTSNWEIKTSGIVNLFYNCCNLKHLNIGGWDTSKWSPNSINSLFTYCSNLTDLDLSGWNTSNWQITDMYIAFMSCKSLVKLDLSSWDTSNWEVTNFQYTFADCKSLQNINIKNWNVGGWKPTSIYQVFADCNSLKEIDLSGWDVSGWDTLYNIGSLFSGCHSLKKIKTNWNTSNWHITGCSAMFNNCTSLREFDIDKWDVSNWEPTSLASFFNGCFSITEVDLSDWDCSNWALTSVNSMFSYCFNLQKIVFPTSLDLSNATVNDIFRNLRSVAHINRFNSSKAINYGGLYILSHQSLVNIFTSLPTVSTDTTITIGANNQHKLTAAEIAVATQKGWTVA